MIVVADNTVLMVGLALLTVKGSHGLVAALLFASPLYDARNANDPVALNVTAREFGTIPPVTVTVDATAPVPVQVPLLNTLYVTVPVAWNAPVSTDESLAVVPTVILVEDTVVAMVGLAF